MTTETRRRYFAYGSNMARGQMENRCAGASPVGVARLRGYRFMINVRGIATVVPKSGATTYGVLWLVTDDDQRALDQYEGVSRGYYIKEELPVNAAEGQLTALIYLAADSSFGTARDGYMEGIVEAAEAWRLPIEYVRELRTWVKTHV